MAALNLLLSTGASTPFTSLSTSSSSPFVSTFLIASSNSFARLQKKSNYLNQKLFNGRQTQTPFNLKERFAVIVKVSSDTDSTGTVPDPLPPSEKKSVGVEELPLESKMQLMADQRLKMKLAKKIRLRRKRLVRKRHLRKKGRWPPSKMKKHKNV